LDFNEENIKKEKKDNLEKSQELEKILKVNQEELEILNKDFSRIKSDFDKEDKKRTEFLELSSQINSLKSKESFFIKQNEKNISDLALLKEKIIVLQKKF
jgi:DNA gyrase/topoisomerase IV subunit A